MGRQINFFMNEEDIRCFFEYLITNFKIVIANSDFYEEKNRNNSHQYLREFGPEDISPRLNYYLFNQDISDEVRLEFIEKQNKYSVDNFKNLYIEFIPPRLNNNDELFEGRLYIPTQDWRYEKLDEKKMGEMEKWYNQLVRWFKKSYTKIPKYGLYIGPNALQQYREGKLKIGFGWGTLDKENFKI